MAKKQRLRSHVKDKGRPTKLTPELQNEICNAIMRGLYVETACAMYGIHKSNYYEWLKKGAKEKLGQKHREFRDAVEKAMAESEARDTQMMDFFAHGSTQYGLKPNWYALAWKMERKYPKRWGRKEMVKLVQEKDDAEEFDSEHDLHLKVVRALAKRNGFRKE